MLRYGVLLAAALAGCGGRAVSGSDGGTAFDGPRDARPPDDRSLADAPRPGCERLANFAGGRRLTALHAGDAIFGRALDRVLLIGEGDSGAGDLVSIALPSGVETRLEGGIDWVAELGPGALLARRPTGSAGIADVLLIRGAGPGEVIAKMACAFLPAPDGKVIYAVSDCDADWLGRLERIDLASGSRKEIASEVHGASLAVGKDGRAGYVVDPQPTPVCPDELGALHVLTREGKKLPSAGNARPGSLQFLADGRLLFGGCLHSNIGLQLMVVDPSGSNLKPLGSPHDYGYFGYLTGRRYEVSSDGKHVLGANVDDIERAELFLVRTGDGGETRLAEDLFPYLVSSMIFRAWGFTADGSRAIYTQVIGAGTMGLASVPGGAPGKIVSLTPKLFGGAYSIAPTGSEVAIVEREAQADKHLLAVVDAASGVRVAQYHSTATIGELSYTPDGRGLLFLERSWGAAKPGNLLRYSPTAFGSTAVIGHWEQSALRRYYRVDPSSCAVLYDTDLEKPGTYLALLPP